MRKATISKLTLTRDTVRLLDTTGLKAATGGLTLVDTCASSCYGSVCDLCTN